MKSFIKRRLGKWLLISIVALGLVGCNRDADIASKNLSYEADNFQLDRRVIFYNGIIGQYMLNIEGRCSIKDQARQLEVTCKVGKDKYKKHFLGLSDNVTYFVEQLEPKGVSVYHYKVAFKPQTILPDVDFKGDAKEVVRAIAPDNKD